MPNPSEILQYNTKTLETKNAYIYIKTSTLFLSHDSLKLPLFSLPLNLSDD